MQQEFAIVRSASCLARSRSGPGPPPPLQRGFPRRLRCPRVLRAAPRRSDVTCARLRSFVREFKLFKIGLGSVGREGRREGGRHVRVDSRDDMPARTYRPTATGHRWRGVPSLHRIRFPSPTSDCKKGPVPESVPPGAGTQKARVGPTPTDLK